MFLKKVSAKTTTDKSWKTISNKTKLKIFFKARFMVIFDDPYYSSFGKSR